MIKRNLVIAFAFLFLSTIHTFAIEDLQLSVQSSNVVLAWPSVDDGSETYLIQYRPTLSPDSSWLTLTDYLAAAQNTNITFFIHSNIVQYPDGGLGGGGGSPPEPEMMMNHSVAASKPSVPMVIPADGSGVPVPLAIYPPGFDLSNLVILDPATGERVSGNGYSIRSFSANGGQANGMQPMDANSDDTNCYTGFYRVVRDGAHLVGVTNGTIWTDFVSLPVELGNASGFISTMSLTEDGDPVGDSIQPAGTRLLVDSTQMSNGVHQVSLSAQWSDTNGNITEASSPPVSVTVSNEISYPNWIPAFGELGNTMTIIAMSRHTNADWQIDVYGSDYHYIGSFSGTTTDGNIQVYWNLVDGNGVTHTNDSFFICQITTFFDIDSGTSSVHPLTTGSSSSITPPTYKVNDPWLGPGKFAIAMQHAFDNTVDHELLYDELKGFTGAAHGVFGVLPSQGGDVPYAIPYRDDNGSNGDPAAGWAAFRNALYDPYVRNLVYFGHGGEAGLGHNISNTNYSILATEIGSTLHNTPAGQTNAHRFRFVFIDGCSTAKGMMPEAFGIIHKVGVPDINYYYASLRRSCYCGWDDDKSIDYVNGSALNYGHVDFITDIQTDMLLNGATIAQGVKYASDDPAVKSTFTTTGDFKIYGCPDVSFGSDNN